MQLKVQAKDKEKAILIKEPKSLKRQAQIKLDKEVARQLEAKLNANVDWNAIIEQVQKREKLTDVVMNYQALKRKPLTEREVRKEKEVEVESSETEGDCLEKEVAKKQKMKQETEELKKHL
nr:hypothetical protein [Tanacetum cinerariifolium]